MRLFRCNRRWVRIGDTLVVITNRNPLLLAAVSRTGETVEHLTQMLDLVYETVVFFATEKPLQRLRSDPFFGIESSVAGTQPSIHHAIRFANRSPAITADAVPMLAMPLAARTGLAGALRVGASGTLAAVLVVGGEIAAFTAHPKHPLRPRDLLLLIAFVQSSSSFRSSEAFVPLCLPGVAPGQFLHAHISCALSAPRGNGRSGAAFAEPVSCHLARVPAEGIDDSATTEATAATAAAATTAATRVGGDGGGAGVSEAATAADRTAIARGIASTSLAITPRPTASAAAAVSGALSHAADGALSGRVASRVARLRAEQSASPASAGLPRSVQAAASAHAAAAAYTRAVAGSLRTDAPDATPVVSGEDAISMSGPGQTASRRESKPASALAADAQVLAALRRSEVVLPEDAAPALIAAAEEHILTRAVMVDEETAMQRLEAFASDAQAPAAVFEAEPVDAGAESTAGTVPKIGTDSRHAAEPDFAHRFRSTATHPRDDCYLIVIGTDITADAVTALRGCSSKVHDQLRRRNMLSPLRTAVVNGGREASSYGFLGIVHFVYFWKPLRQLSVGRFPVHLRSHRARKRLLRRYQHLWADVTCSTPSVRHIVVSSPDGTVGAINTTYAIVMCLTAGGGSAGGATQSAGSVVKLMEDLARVLKAERSALLQERGLTI